MELDSVLGYIYGLLFVICNVFLLVPNFYGIILSTYTNLRLRMQLTTQAMTEIATDESKNMTMKWVNLFFCIPPKSEKDIH